MASKFNIWYTCMSLHMYMSMHMSLIIILLSCWTCEGFVQFQTHLSLHRSPEPGVYVCNGVINKKTQNHISRIMLASTPTRNSHYPEEYIRYNDDRNENKRRQSKKSGSGSSGKGQESESEQEPILIKKRSEQTSNFWHSDPIKPPILEDDVLPCEYNLDINGKGTLPFGSYRTLGIQKNDEHDHDTKPTCLMTVNMNFWNTRASSAVTGTGAGNKDQTSTDSENEIDPNLVVSNMHELIDSGLTTFAYDYQGNNPSRSFSSMRKGEESAETSSFMTPSKEQTYMERTIYNNLIKDTPQSVLEECNLGTKLNVPKWNYEGEFGNGSIIREMIGTSICNMYDSANGCLDSVQVMFQPGKPSEQQQPYGTQNAMRRSMIQSTSTSGSTAMPMSPYIFDVMNVLTEMQREGLIRSIHGIHFTSDAIKELNDCGFYLDSNSVECNLLDPTKFQVGGDMYRTCQRLEKEHGSSSSSLSNRKAMRMVFHSPLAGGLLTNKYAHISRRHRSKTDEPLPSYMLPSEKRCYDTSLNGSWKKYYEEVHGTKIKRQHAWHACEENLYKELRYVALKHRVDEASVALRWVMQMDHAGSVSVGSSLNTGFDEGKPFTRPRDLRKAFSFHLDEEDMERLADVAGRTFHDRSGEDDFDFDPSTGWTSDPAIDFANPKLWL